MVKAFIYLVLAVVLAIGLAWFADRPGEIIIYWQNYKINVTLFVTTVLVILLVTALLFLGRIVRKVLMTPGRFRRRMRQRRIERGYAALRRGVFAVGAGDEALAARYAAEARRTLPKEPLTQLLLAQSAQLSGDRRTAQRLFEAMSEDHDTQLLGLRGLFLEASWDGQMEAAQQFAARAMGLNPVLAWPVHALFDMQCKSHNWEGALETLDVARNHRHIDRRTADRRRAVLLTAQAMDLQEPQPDKAAELAMEAHRMAPGFVPAANVAGRILAARDSAYKAARVLARTWQYTPHPDLATAYAYLRPGDSPRDRLARIKSLIVLTPDHVEARIALARAACDARDWEEARDALQPLITKNPTARVCALMARIEGGEKRDAGRVREWLARAVRAPRDAVWMADGVASNEWAPVSPVTGKLDAFEWQVPSDVQEPATGPDDALLDEIGALSRELETVARPDTGLTDTAAPVPPAGPVTITVTAVETTPPAPVTPKNAVAVDRDNGRVEAEPVEKPKSALSQASSAKGALATEMAAEPVTPKMPPRKIETKIFIPDRPPDDPGPGAPDIEDATTPIGRFRNASK